MCGRHEPIGPITKLHPQILTQKENEAAKADSFTQLLEQGRVFLPVARVTNHPDPGSVAAPCGHLLTQRERLRQAEEQIQQARAQCGALQQGLSTPIGQGLSEAIAGQHQRQHNGAV